MAAKIWQGGLGGIGGLAVLGVNAFKTLLRTCGPALMLIRRTPSAAPDPDLDLVDGARAGCKASILKSKNVKRHG